MKHSKKTKKKMSEARKADWANKKNMSNKINFTKNMASIYKQTYRDHAKDDLEAHIAAHKSLIKSKSFIGSILGWFGL